MDLIVFCAKAMIVLLVWHFSGTGLVDLFEYAMLSFRILKDEAGYSSERDGVGELMIGFWHFAPMTAWQFQEDRPSTRRLLSALLA